METRQQAGEPSAEAAALAEDLEKAAKRVAEKHGYKLAKPIAAEIGGNVFFNISVYSQKPDEVYRDWYLSNADSMGLNKSWLGASFENHDQTRTLVVVGLDPDGGERCIRVRDRKGSDYHISPATLSRLITKSA